MERNIQKTGLINLLLLLLTGVAGFAVARSANSLAGQISVVFIGLGFLVALVSWFQMRLEERERLEKLELDELARARGSSALFDTDEAELFPAQRSREQFERFFVPFFTIVLLLAEAVSAFFFWRWLSKPAVPIGLKQPMMAMFLFALFFLVLFLLGKFSASIAQQRPNDHRLLRPGASFLLLGAYLSLLVSLGIVGVLTGFEKSDFYVACVLSGLLALMAVESLLALVLEMYRPRVRGKVQRPLYESRLAGLLAQPEGLITTAAQALDYQFGFKVSETGFYRFFEKWLGWLILAQLAVLFLSTAIVFIEAGEEALLERFGRPVSGRTVLGPGAHVKWPWPIDKIYRFRTEQIQSFEIGSAPDEMQETNRFVLWSVAHTKEDNFLVANREPARSGTDQSAVKRTPPVSLITGTIPVQFQITNLTDWAYNNEDASSLLQDVATREVVRYLAGVDMNEVMSIGRLEAAQALQTRIQNKIGEHNLGAKIISVGLDDLHPPVKVAADYEKVIGAIHTKEAKILAARAEEVKTNALADAQATVVVNRAHGESTERVTRAVAQAGLFTNQIPAFDAAPSVYAQRIYLKTFVNATANARKYVNLTTNAHDVYTIDVQERIREDILGSVSVNPKK